MEDRLSSDDAIRGYHLIEEIGEGGMGMVYRAEQTEPVTRTVAVKVIKQGLDTKEVVARFDAERQALAMMDHSGIARVLDAGATEKGRPYFAMELVSGVPITQYCEENRLSTRERLELFVDICRAVQHAHQKGIIHRDLKPSNILVSVEDGKAQPKIIDFGIAKATSGKKALHEFQPSVRHSRLHESGATGGERARSRHPDGHLRSRRHSLRTADETVALRSRAIGNRRQRGIGAHPLGRGASATQHEAIALLEECLEESTKLHSENDSQTLLMATLLGNLHHRNGREERAREYLEMANRWAEQDDLAHEASPDHLDSLNNRAVSHMQLKEFDDALPLLQRSLELSRRALGPVHPSTLSTVHNLAAIYVLTKQPEKALPLYINGREVARSTMPEGPLHGGTLAVESVNALSEQLYFAFEIDPLHLQEGPNHIAVEVHQGKPDSSDLVFDLEIQALRKQP